jgi:hypothetical protein
MNPLTLWVTLRCVHALTREGTRPRGNRETQKKYSTEDLRQWVPYRRTIRFYASLEENIHIHLQQTLTEL